MSPLAEQNSGGLHFLPPLLITESQDRFASLYAELEQDIQPKGPIERTYVFDIANITWDIERYRRYKTVIINNSWIAALQGILEQILCRQNFDGEDDHEETAEALAHGWFENKRVKTQVANMLRQFQLDESAIEAEAFRLMSSDIDRMDRMLTLAEVRRDKALRNIAEYRDSLSLQLRQTSERILKYRTRTGAELIMASKRQIAANRRNAAKSKGPRSETGKKRASHNAFRHGLTVPLRAWNSNNRSKSWRVKSLATPRIR